jgi:hypothetical protein
MSEYAAIVLCADCVQWAANREDSGAGAEWLEWMEAHPDRMIELGRAVVTCDGEDTHESFSSEECGGCDTRLAGDRCPAEIPRVPVALPLPPGGIYAAMRAGHVSRKGHELRGYIASVPGDVARRVLTCC